MDFQRSYRCYHCHQKFNIGLEAVNHIIAEHPNKISLLNRLKDWKRQPMHYPYSSTELSSKTSINLTKQRHRLPSESIKLTHHLQKTCLVLPWSQYPKTCFITTPCLMLIKQWVVQPNWQLMNQHRQNTFILILNIAHMTQEDQCLVR